MGYVLNEPDARISQIKYVPYIRQTIEAMWELYAKLEGCTDAYSRYTRLKAASTIREIASKLYQGDLINLNQIGYRDRPFCMPSQAEMITKIKELIKDEPRFLTAYLCLAGQCRNITEIRVRKTVICGFCRKSRMEEQNTHLSIIGSAIILKRSMIIKRRRSNTIRQLWR